MAMFTFDWTHVLKSLQRLLCSFSNLKEKKKHPTTFLKAILGAITLIITCNYPESSPKKMNVKWKFATLWPYCSDYTESCEVKTSRWNYFVNVYSKCGIQLVLNNYTFETRDSRTDATVRKTRHSGWFSCSALCALSVPGSMECSSCCVR